MASPASAAPSSAVAAPPLSPPSPPGDEALDPDPEPDPSSAAPAPAAMAPAAPAPAATAPAAPATAATATAPAPAAPTDRGTEQAAPAADAGVVALGWQEVSYRRRPLQSVPPRSPLGDGEDRAMAFRRRVRGRCFRCLARGHRVADCHGEIRCLSCNRSGHRERDCCQHQQAGQAPPQLAGQAPLCSGSPAAVPCCPLDRSWASVAAHPAVHVGRSRAQSTAGAASACVAAVHDATLKSVFAEQAALLRAELRGLASVPVEEMVVPMRVVTESLQGLLERFRSLMERVEFELFGCSSPVDATPSAVSETGFPMVEAMPNQQELVVESVVLSPLEELAVVPLVPSALHDFVDPDSEEKTTKGTVQVDADEPVEEASAPLAGELFKELAYIATDSPTDLQVGEAAPSLIERRSSRLDKKNKGCDIPAAKRAEYRRAVAFGEVPKNKGHGKATEKAVNEKMQFYLQMYTQGTQHAPQTVEAIRALVEVNV